MNKIGTFKITGSFKVTGRGRVAMGQILDGKVRSGAHAYIQIEQKNLLCRIVGVDFGDIDLKGNFFVGLAIRNEEIDLLNLAVNDQIIDILYND